MQTLRCKCGKSVLYTTDGPGRSCQGCTECSTTFAWNPQGHRELEPHRWIDIYDEYTGLKNDKECSRCFTRESYELKLKKESEENQIKEQKQATRPKAYELYDLAIKKSVEKHGTIPHCDSNILHNNDCKYCVQRPELQNARLSLNINFTGENDPNKLMCPAEARRSLENINKWHGNVAQEKV